jgi:hypothetical protein
MRFCVNTQRNTKSDVFGANGNLIGNWPAMFNVGHVYNAALRGDTSGYSITGVGYWLGEVTGFGDAYGSSATPLTVNWSNDASYDGTRLGGGNYTPGVGNALPRIPAGMAPFSVDIMGRSVSNTGTAVVGAIQMA